MKNQKDVQATWCLVLLCTQNSILVLPLRQIFRHRGFVCHPCPLQGKQSNQVPWSTDGRIRKTTDQCVGDHYPDNRRESSHCPDQARGSFTSSSGPITTTSKSMTCPNHRPPASGIDRSPAGKYRCLFRKAVAAPGINLPILKSSRAVKLRLSTRRNHHRPSLPVLHVTHQPTEAAARASCSCHAWVRSPFESSTGMP